jgi:glycine/D-amino acid oxidase-like deaminating enzyme
MSERPRIVIVGAGIIGATLSWHLQRHGAQVTLLDAAAPGGIATRHSWAWINASWGNPETYFRLRHQSMQDWHQLVQDVPELTANWCGGLIWDMPPEELTAYVKQHAAWGYDIRLVGRAEIAQLEPHLANPPEQAAYVAEEGSIEPLAAAQTLLTAADALGAEIVSPVTVEAVDLTGGKVTGVRTAAGHIPADHVVLAAGVATASLAATAGFTLPLTAPPGLLAVTEKHARLLNGLVMMPGLHIRQMPNGRLIAGADFGGGDLPADPAEAEAVAADAAAELFDAMCWSFAPRADLVFDHHTIGYRPIPGDGFPAIGRVPGIEGLSIAVTHSGITLAPAIGRGLADEILNGKTDPLLAPYGLERFSDNAVGGNKIS